MTDTKGQARFSQVPAEAVLDQDLTETDFRVLSIIGLYLNRDKEAWPMQSTVADQLGKSSTTVNRSIKRLEAKGYIRSRKKYEDRPGTHRIYQVVFEQPGIGKNDHSGISSIERTSGISSKGRNSHKNNPKEQPNKDMSDLAGRLWVMSPETARKRSSTAKVKSAVKAALKRGVNPDDLMTAYQNYLNAPDTKKQGYKFAKGIHSWISEDRFESWFSPSPQNQSGALPQASVVPMGQKETIDELLAKRDAERARSAAMGGGQNGDAPADMSGVQPHSQEETLEMFERDPRGLEDARLLSSL
jgi:hypothetical protein